MATGKITQIIGAVIDVEFPRESIPRIYEALKLKDVELTLEVQQQLGDGVVRTIAMGASEGLKRGILVESTGKPINVPVGQATLGRIMDVLGVPQDNRGPVAAKETLPIHRPAPSYDEQAGGQDLLVTGIKVIDLLVPFAKGGKVGLFGGAGVGKTVNMLEPSSTRVCPCSQASVNVLAKATISITRWPNRASSTSRTSRTRRSRWCTAR